LHYQIAFYKLKKNQAMKKLMSMSTMLMLAIFFASLTSSSVFAQNPTTSTNSTHQETQKDKKDFKKDKKETAKDKKYVSKDKKKIKKDKKANHQNQHPAKK